jgi:hypothetical protein
MGSLSRPLLLDSYLLNTAFLETRLDILRVDGENSCPRGNEHANHLSSSSLVNLVCEPGLKCPGCISTTGCIPPVPRAGNGQFAADQLVLRPFIHQFSVRVP